MKLRFTAYLPFLFFILFSSQNISGAITGIVPDTVDFYSDNYLRNDNHVYQKYIQAVKLSRVGFDLADPIITFGSGEQFHVVFDDLHRNFTQYYYQVQHCNADWAKSEIWTNEYLEGSEEDQVENYEPSFNTRTIYTHYEFSFPNDRFILKKSGNYILRVFSRDQSGHEINAFTRRFMVVEPKVTIDATISRAGTSEDYETKQEVDFTINTSGFRIDAPYQDIKVVILQNWRWDIALTNLKPYMVRNDELDYSFDNGTNLFDGINEFRRFDLSSIKLISEKVREITFDDSMFYAKLWESEKRTYKEYISDDDINGKFLLKTVDYPSVSNYGEYAMVKFYLPFDAPIVEGNLYVAGGFNCWQYTPENKMEYNYRKKAYESSILFKQGYYNYLYVMLPNNSKAGDATWIEGNHSETKNNYTILVYHRSRGELYDELIGTGSFESGK
ncbi:MAG: DUF5103 domain-containing protein [Bacteroidales bacterium]|nr:DUF5103 domain-containing protein [Bacteroidales bacterium]